MQCNFFRKNSKNFFLGYKFLFLFVKLTIVLRQLICHKHVDITVNLGLNMNN